MNHKKSIIIFFTLSVIFITALPFINYVNNPKNFDIKNMFKTDVIESYSNYLFLKTFNKSLEWDRAIAGKDGFLFLGDKHNHVLFKTQNIYPYSKKDIEIWVNNLNELQRWYEEKGVKFIMVLVPNKHSVYRDKLPDWINSNGVSITDQLVELSNKSDLNLLDLRKVFLAKRQSSNELLYYRSDSHWNQFGASIGYNEIINFLNSKYKQEYKKVEYTYGQLNSRAYDLKKILKITDFDTKNIEEVTIYNLESNQKVCLGSFDTKTNELNSCKVTKNQSFGIHKGGHYIKNQQSLNKEKVLFLCDSFATQNSRLFNSTFNTIWKFHYNLFLEENLSNFVNKHHPDIVIYQIAERNFYKNNFLKNKLD